MSLYATLLRCTDLISYFSESNLIRRQANITMNWLKVFSYFSLILLSIPLIVLLYEGFGPMSVSRGYSIGFFRSVELTLIGSVLAVLISVVLYTPVAYHFARNESKITQSIAYIPASIPHPIVGIALLLLVSPLTPLGQFLLSIGFNLFDTLLGYVVCLVIVSAPIYIKAIQPFFESMNRSHENYAIGLGASQLRTFVSVVLPNSGRGVLSASLIALSRGISEFGSVFILVPVVLQFPFYGDQSAAVYIVQEYQSGDLAAAVTSSALLIIISFAISFALTYVQPPLRRK